MPLGRLTRRALRGREICSEAQLQQFGEAPLFRSKISNSVGATLPRRFYLTASFSCNLPRAADNSLALLPSHIDRALQSSELGLHVLLLGEGSLQALFGGRGSCGYTKCKCSENGVPRRRRCPNSRQQILLSLLREDLAGGCLMDGRPGCLQVSQGLLPAHADRSSGIRAERVEIGGQRFERRVSEGKVAGGRMRGGVAQRLGRVGESGDLVPQSFEIAF